MKVRLNIKGFLVGFVDISPKSLKATDLIASGKMERERNDTRRNLQKSVRSLKASNYQGRKFDTYSVVKSIRFARRVSPKALPDAIKFVAFSDFGAQRVFTFSSWVA